MRQPGQKWWPSPLTSKQSSLRHSGSIMFVLCGNPIVGPTRVPENQDKCCNMNAACDEILGPIINWSNLKKGPGLHLDPKLHIHTPYHCNAAVCHVLCAASWYTSNYTPFMVANRKVITVTRDCQVMSMDCCHAISWRSRGPLNQQFRRLQRKVLLRLGSVQSKERAGVRKK